MTIAQPSHEAPTAEADEPPEPLVRHRAAGDEGVQGVAPDAQQRRSLRNGQNVVIAVVSARGRSDCVLVAAATYVGRFGNQRGLHHRDPALPPREAEGYDRDEYDDPLSPGSPLPILASLPMHKSTFEDALARLTNAGISTDAFFAAMVYVDDGGFEGLLENVEERNEQRLTAAVALQALLDGHAFLFLDDEVVASDMEIAVRYETARSALGDIVGRLRLNGAERTVRAVEKATLLRCRDLGELARTLSEKGISYRDQAHLLLNPLPGKKHALRVRNRAEGEAETDDMALDRVTTNLKVAAHRTQKKSGTTTKDGDQALVATVFPPDDE
jgi:hypothetical protein